MLIKILKNIYYWIYDKISSPKKNFRIKEEGLIFIGRTEINSIEIEIIIRTTLKLIKEIERKSYEKFYKKSQEVDEFIINLIILISFSTEEGFRAVEKTLVRTEFKINENDYNHTKQLLNKKLIEIFEEYNIEIIEEIAVKMF